MTGILAVKNAVISVVRGGVGIVGSLNNEDKKLLAEIFLAFFNQNYHTIAKLYIDNGWVGPATDIPKFEKTIEDVCRPIFAKPLAEISFGNVLLQLFDAARQFDLIVQPQLDAQFAAHFRGRYSHQAHRR